MERTFTAKRSHLGINFEKVLKAFLKAVKDEVEENSWAIYKLLKVIAVIEIITALTVFAYDVYQSIMYQEPKVYDLGQRLSVEEQMYLDIQAMELPQETEIQVLELTTEIELVLETLATELIPYYIPTEEERRWAYFVAFSEAGIEDALGQTLVTNVAINRAIEKGVTLDKVYTEKGQYSSVVNGVPSIMQNGKWIPVTEDMISDELKAAVDAAFEKDYTVQFLKAVAEDKGLDASYYEGGALFFYNPDAISDHQASLRANIKVAFKYGRHIFYRVWDM